MKKSFDPASCLMLPSMETNFCEAMCYFSVIHSLLYPCQHTCQLLKKILFVNFVRACPYHLEQSLAGLCY